MASDETFVLYVVDMYDDDEEKPIDTNPESPTTLKLSVSKSHSVASLKAEVQRQKGYDAASQRLLFLRQVRVFPECFTTFIAPVEMPSITSQQL